MTRGKLIALEGIDGAGTTSQAEHLQESLAKEGLFVYRTRMPSDGLVGSLARSFFKDPSLTMPPFGRALLFASDFIQQMDAEIMPILNAGKDVIVDRFTPLSAMAYQTLQTPPVVISDLYNKIYDLGLCTLDPDATFMLDCPVEVAKERRIKRNQGKDYYDDDQFQEHARRVYQLLAVQTKVNFRLIDSSRDFETVTEEILRITKEIINGTPEFSESSGPGGVEE